MDFTGIHLQQHGKIRMDVDSFSVQFQNPVTDLQTLRTVHGAERLKAFNYRRNNLLHRQINNNHQQYAYQEIHGRAGYKNDQPLPPRRPVKGAGIVAVSVLTLHGAKAADGNQPKGVQGFPHLL